MMAKNKCKEILVFGLSSNRGGIETYLYKIASHINREQYHLSFINMVGKDKSPCFYKELQDLGCSFFRVTPRSDSIRKNKQDLEDLFAQYHFDILHYNANTLSYIKPIIAALRHGCKVIIHSRSSGMTSRFITEALHHINKFRVRHMDVKRIAVSTQAGKWLFGNSNFDLFHNGVDTKKFTFSSNARKAIRIDNMLSDELVIGHIGAFLPVKNHIFVVDLFKEFYKRHPDTRLWLIGEGYLKENIQNLVREEGMSEVVSFFGNYEDMSSVYAGMDVLLLPSLFEGFPNVVLEAQSEGLPCLLSDRITDEVVLFDSAKRLSLDDTKQVWLDELESVYQKRSFMREDAAAVVDRKGYSVNVEVKRIEKLYSSLASDKTMR